MVKYLQSFSVIWISKHWQHVKFGFLPSNILMRYLHPLRLRVERRVMKVPSERFTIIFDWQRTESAHYISVFASFLAATAGGFKKVCLALSTIEYESMQSGGKHTKPLTFVSDVLKRSVSNVTALIGDNCSTNWLVTTKLKNVSIGYASHRF